MKLVSISESYNKGRSVKFIPVSGDSEENRRFFQATPSGSIELGLSESAAKNLALDAAKIGSEFYVDLTPIP